MLAVVPASAPELQCGRFDNLRLGWCRRILIKSMNAPEQPSIQLPVSDDVVIKITEDVKISAGNASIFNGAQFLYSSTQEIADKLGKFIVSYAGKDDFFGKEIKAKVIEPGKKWVTGTIRLRLVIEFIPDELENNKTLGEPASSLDCMRSRNL